MSASSDITANYHRGNPESVEAFANLTTGARDRRRVLVEIARQGSYGLTCDEVEQMLGMSHQSASARCSELRKSGAILVAGKRLTRAGRRAAVLVAA